MLLISTTPAACAGAWQDSLQNLTEPYLGQELPGRTPIVFELPGGDYLFYNDGRECLIFGDGIWHAELRSGEWSKPSKQDIDCGKYYDFEPNISADGQTIYFCSIDRPLADGRIARWSQIWITEKSEAGWSNPKATPFEGMYASVTLDGTLYYTADMDGRACIARSAKKDGKYTDQ